MPSTQSDYLSDSDDYYNKCVYMYIPILLDSESNIFDKKIDGITTFKCGKQIDLIKSIELYSTKQIQFDIEDGTHENRFTIYGKNPHLSRMAKTLNVKTIEIMLNRFTQYDFVRCLNEYIYSVDKQNENKGYIYKLYDISITTTDSSSEILPSPTKIYDRGTSTEELIRDIVQDRMIIEKYYISVEI
ncbi:hypothetical protein ENUP19_0058G0019 [Entamoeba nuttalli]|uniref:Uncharacterized protein n=1 Tax=Entamoeba nuttalli TaxID=412467 RepID=A0ABQ0DD57_9EUKA